MAGGMRTAEGPHLSPPPPADNGGEEVGEGAGLHSKHRPARPVSPTRKSAGVRPPPLDFTSAVQEAPRSPRNTSPRRMSPFHPQPEEMDTTFRPVSASPLTSSPALEPRPTTSPVRPKESVFPAVSPTKSPSKQSRWQSPALVATPVDIPQTPPLTLSYLKRGMPIEVLYDGAWYSATVREIHSNNTIDADWGDGTYAPDLPMEEFRLPVMSYNQRQSPRRTPSPLPSLDQPSSPQPPKAALASGSPPRSPPRSPIRLRTSSPPRDPSDTDRAEQLSHQSRHVSPPTPDESGGDLWDRAETVFRTIASRCGREGSPLAVPEPEILWVLRSSGSEALELLRGPTPLALDGGPVTVSRWYEWLREVNSTRPGGASSTLEWLKGVLSRTNQSRVWYTSPALSDTRAPRAEEAPWQSPPMQHASAPGSIPSVSPSRAEQFGRRDSYPVATVSLASAEPIGRRDSYPRPTVSPTPPESFTRRDSGTAADAGLVRRESFTMPKKGSPPRPVPSDSFTPRLSPTASPLRHRTPPTIPGRPPTCITPPRSIISPPFPEPQSDGTPSMSSIHEIRKKHALASQTQRTHPSPERRSSAERHRFDQENARRGHSFYEPCPANCPLRAGGALRQAGGLTSPYPRWSAGDRSLSPPNPEGRGPFNPRQTVPTTRKSPLPPAVVVSGVVKRFRGMINGKYRKVPCRPHDESSGVQARYNREGGGAVLYRTRDGRWRLNDSESTVGWVFSNAMLLGQWTEDADAGDYTGASGTMYPSVAPAEVVSHHTPRSTSRTSSPAAKGKSRSTSAPKHRTDAEVHHEIDRLFGQRPLHSQTRSNSAAARHRTHSIGGGAMPRPANTSSGTSSFGGAPGSRFRLSPCKSRRGFFGWTSSNY